MKNKIVLFIFLTFFVFFVILLLAESQGYYKNRNEKAKILTDEQIKEFEKDISEGKDIDIKKYVLYEDKDYSNEVASNVYKVSLKLESAIDSVIKMVFSSAADAVKS